MTDDHRCISCGRIDEGPNAECDCMEPGPPCAICGDPEWEPLTPWKSNYHWAEDGHEFVRAVSPGPMHGGEEVTDKRALMNQLVTLYSNAWLFHGKRGRYLLPTWLCSRLGHPRWAHLFQMSPGQFAKSVSPGLDEGDR